MSANGSPCGRLSTPALLVEQNAEASYAWYVIHTKAREEYRAQENLLRQGYEVFLPVLHRERLTAGKKVVAEEPLFTRYLFVSLSETDSNWYSIRSTRGVQRIVEFGQGPVAVPDDLILKLKSGTRVVQPSFKPGDAVQITEGPFRHILAIYAAPDGEQRAFLLIDLLNDQRKVSFPLTVIR